MNLRNLIDQLIESEIIENQELGLTLLRSPEITEEEKRTHIDSFVKSYLEGNIDFNKEEQRNILQMWVEIYLSMQEGEVKNRVKKIKS
jgi:hypothetical protein